MAGNGCWQNLLPASIKQSDCELANVAKLGGEPAVRIVPNKSDDEDAVVKPSSITVKAKSGMKEDFRKFGGSPNVEDALRHIQLFNSIAEKSKFQSEYALYKEQRSKLKEKI